VSQRSWVVCNVYVIHISQRHVWRRDLCVCCTAVCYSCRPIHDDLLPSVYSYPRRSCQLRLRRNANKLHAIKTVLRVTHSQSHYHNVVCCRPPIQPLLVFCQLPERLLYYLYLQRRYHNTSTLIKKEKKNKQETELAIYAPICNKRHWKPNFLHYILSHFRYKLQ